VRTSGRLLAAGLCLAWLVLCGAGPTTGASSAPARGSGGAVSSAEAAATEVGLEILRAGGNAVDAAVATALALAVVHPQAGNLGGGGFAMALIEGEIYSLDFRETAPASASETMYLDDSGAKIPWSSWIGPLASGTPGSPYGLWELHNRHGRLEWPKIVEPAIKLARGFTVSQRLVRSIEYSRKLLLRFEDTAAVWLPDGQIPAAGSVMELPDLERTLELFAKHGPAGVTEGAVAAAVTRSSAEHGGILSAGDLADYRPVWRQPVVFEAFGWTFASMGLPSSGAMIIGQSLQMLEQLGYQSQPRLGAERAHLLTEVWRRAFADRYLLGDPQTTYASIETLLEPAWLKRRALEIDPAKASDSQSVLSWQGEAPPESTETTHLSVIDGDGNVVAITTTLNGSFGCGLLVAGAGYFLNNEMDDFTTAPAEHNAFGLMQSEANLVRPGQRMLSSMTPTVAWRGGEVLSAGAAGGPIIPTATLQVLLGVIVDGLDVQAAVSQPRIHHQWRPDKLFAEVTALSPETAAELTRRGHTLENGDNPKLARVQAVRLLSDGSFEAAGDPRGPAVPGVVDPLPD
jgi:gamma-glutamyltranspeptidase/glutathione hydrolase